MTATNVLTEVLDTSTPDLAARTFSLDGGRCAADIVVAAAGIAWWRARLDVTAAQLVVGSSNSLTARMSVRLRFASIPLTQRRFLRSVRADEALILTVADLPDLSTEVTSANGLVTTEDRIWTVRVAVRLVADETDRLVVALSGTVVRDEAAPLVVPHLGFEAAAELVRCD